jgi:hypothetical protein
MSRQYVKPDIPEDAKHRLFMQVGGDYSRPSNAAKEYITNALDATDKLIAERGLRNVIGRTEIRVLQDPETRRLIFDDMALGMSYDRLVELPGNIGNSVNRDEPDSRGEKGFGLLAFIALGGKERGSNVELISREAGSDRYNSLKLSVENGELHPTVGEISGEQMEEFYYGEFEHGTRVMLNLDVVTFRDHFSKFGFFRNKIREIYAPLLFRNDIPIYVGMVGKEHEKLNPPKCSGKPLLGRFGRNFEFEAQTKIDGVKQNVKYPISVHLLVDPEAQGNIGVFAKDVRIYSKLTEMLADDDKNDKGILDLPTFSCGRVSGWINNRNLELVLGREGINKATNAYQNLLKFMRELNEKVWPDVDAELRKGPEIRTNRHIKSALERFTHAYQGTVPINVGKRIVISDGEDETNDDDKNDSNEDEEIKKGPGKKRKGRTGVRRDKRRVPLDDVRVENFTEFESENRSRYEGFAGQPTILINSGHKDYKRIQKQGEMEMERYLLDCMSNEMALWEMNDALQSGRQFGEPLDIAGVVSRRTQDLRLFLAMANGVSNRGGKK